MITIRELVAGTKEELLKHFSDKESVQGTSFEEQLQALIDNGRIMGYVCFKGKTEDSLTIEMVGVHIRQ